jgi:hypothetical protein
MLTQLYGITLAADNTNMLSVGPGSASTPKILGPHAFERIASFLQQWPAAGEQR